MGGWHSRGEPQSNGDVGSDPGAFKTVLVADDDDRVRTLSLELLRQAGYRVIGAPNGAEAIGIAAEHAPGAIHLLLTDILMPGMNGVETANKFSLLHPHAAVLCVSGCSDAELMDQGIELKGLRLLRKPFTREKLLLAAEAALDACEP